jgi:hypothetical protein
MSKLVLKILVAQAKKKKKKKEFFFHFSLVPNVFPLCSIQVPNMFPDMFSIAPPLLSHMLWQMFCAPFTYIDGAKEEELYTSK